MGTNSPQGVRRGWTRLIVVLVLLGVPAQRAIASHNGKGSDNGHGGNCNKTKTCETPAPTPTPTPPPDTVAPTETIDAPSAGTKVSGTVKVAGTATDDVAVAVVDVAIDSDAFAPATGTDTWALPIDTTKLSDGSHTVTARAIDTSGNTSSTKISVDVNNAPADSGGGTSGGTGGSSGGTTSPCDKSLSGGADIQTALNNLSTGQRLCLSGSFTSMAPIQPKSGQTISGPATIVGKGLGINTDLIHIKPAVNVTLVDLDISGAGRHGVTCWIGTTVLGGRLHDNGKDGMGCDMEGETAPVLVSGVEIDHNGTDPDWLDNAAGIKWFHANGVTVKNSSVHDNNGNGLWCDTHCGDFNVLNNTIVHNTRKGVFYEKSGASDGSFGDPTAVYVGKMVVTGNTIRNNDTEGVVEAHPGVAIYSSKNAYVANNVFGGNTRAVIAREDSARLNDDQHGWHLSNVVVENNTLSGDVIVGCTASGVQCSGNV
jgi:hypothetical protein